MPDETNAQNHHFRPAGRSGLKMENGIVREEWDPALKGARGAAVYAEMSVDAVVTAVLFAMEQTLRGVDWYVKPYSAPGEDPTDEDLDNAAFVETCMHDMETTWPDFVAEALEKIVYGWAWFEVIWKIRAGRNKNSGEARSKYDDGRVAWRSFASRSQDTLLRWEYDDSDELVGMVQANGKAGVLIERSRSLHFRTSSRKQNPEGKSLLRGAHTAWFRKKRIEQIEAIGAERDLAGIPAFGVPKELFDAPEGSPGSLALAEWIRVATSLRADEQASIVYPLAYDDHGNQLVKVGLLSAPSARLTDTGGIIERYARQIAMTVMQDVVLLGHEAVGSLALADTKKRLARAALKAQVDEIAAELNQNIVPQLFEFNGLPTDRLARIDVGEIEERNLEDLAGIIAALSVAGVPFDDLEAVNELRTALGIAPLAEFEETEPDPDFVPPRPDVG